jgi:hypothetical protein
MTVVLAAVVMVVAMAAVAPTEVVQEYEKQETAVMEEEELVVPRWEPSLRGYPRTSAPAMFRIFLGGYQPLAGQP